MIIDASKANRNAHFIFFIIDIEAGTADLFDSMFNEHNFHLVVNEKTLKKLFNRILQVTTFGESRSLRSFKYNRLSFNQVSLECGPLSCLVLLISNFVTIQYLQKFVLKNYEASVSRVKSILASILLDQKLFSCLTFPHS